MIATVESIQTNFKPHLSNNQQFESASILAQTDNSTVYAVRVKEKETEREMALKIYSQDSAPPPICSTDLKSTSSTFYKLKTQNRPQFRWNFACRTSDNSP